MNSNPEEKHTPPASREEMLAELLGLYQKLDDSMRRREARELRLHISDRILFILETLKEQLPPVD